MTAGPGRMRYYRVAAAKRSRALRWLQFAGRRPWLDLENPVCDLTLQLTGRHVHDIDLRAVDRSGAPLPLDLFARAPLPKGRSGFTNLPTRHRRRLRLRLRFPGPQRVSLLDSTTGETILDLQPEITYPGFLFALLQELEQSFWPGSRPAFVETGTLFGHTTLHASYWFDRVVSIELSTDLHAQAAAALAHRPNIRCLQGHSATRLPEVIAELSGGPALFFLDAHWSGDAGVSWGTSGWGGYPVDTARLTAPGLSEPDRQVPLLTELETIAREHRGQAAVLIDDWGSIGERDRGFPGEDWRNMDRQQILAWMSGHSRTRFHFPLDPKRYVWGLDAVF